MSSSANPRETGGRRPGRRLKARLSGCSRWWRSGLGSTLLLLTLIAAWGRAQAEAPRASIKAALVLKVASRDEAADALVQQVEVMEGYFSTRTDDALVLKVPIDQMKKFIAFAETLGTVADRQYETQDLGFEIEQLRTRLASREQVMQRYYAVMGDAGRQGVLSVEREITRMVGEIENLRGSIRLIEHRLEYGEVTVTFQFRDRSAPASDGRSSFPWLNTMNLADLVEDFRSGR